MGHLIEPHGGKLVDLYCPQDLADSLKKQSINYFSIDLTARQMFDLELILNGGFSPLQGFMTQAEYESVVENRSFARMVCAGRFPYTLMFRRILQRISALINLSPCGTWRVFCSPL